MGFSDRILGKKNANGGPHIESVSPVLALAGGEIRIAGRGLRSQQWQRPHVRFGEVEGGVVVSSDSFLVARVPEGATSGPVVVAADGHISNSHRVKVAVSIAENLHPVTNLKIDPNYTVKPFVAEMMNATSIAFDREGQMYVSSRNDGAVYRVAPNGTMTTYAEGMGIATGIAFDRNQNLYVGDRSGTIFKIGRDQQVFVFATLEPSVSAYHLAFGPQGDLFVTGPTTSSFDCVHRIDPQGTVQRVDRGLGRTGGLPVDVDGNLYVPASISGRRGIVKISPDGKASLEVAGHGLVGLAFAPGRSVILATTDAVHHLSWNIQGLSLLPE